MFFKKLTLFKKFALFKKLELFQKFRVFSKIPRFSKNLSFSKSSTFSKIPVFPKKFRVLQKYVENSVFFPKNSAFYKSTLKIPCFSQKIPHFSKFPVRKKLELFKNMIYKPNINTQIKYFCKNHMYLQRKTMYIYNFYSFSLCLAVKYSMTFSNSFSRAFT